MQVNPEIWTPAISHALVCESYIPDSVFNLLANFRIQNLQWLVGMNGWTLDMVIHGIRHHHSHSAEMERRGEEETTEERSKWEQWGLGSWLTFEFSGLIKWVNLLPVHAGSRVEGGGEINMAASACVYHIDHVYDSDCMFGCDSFGGRGSLHLTHIHPLCLCVCLCVWWFMEDIYEHD